MKSKSKQNQGTNSILINKYNIPGQRIICLLWTRKWRRKVIPWEEFLQTRTSFWIPPIEGRYTFYVAYDKMTNMLIAVYSLIPRRLLQGPMPTLIVPRVLCRVFLARRTRILHGSRYWIIWTPQGLIAISANSSVHFIHPQKLINSSPALKEILRSLKWVQSPFFLNNMFSIINGWVSLFTTETECISQLAHYGVHHLWLSSLTVLLNFRFIKGWEERSGVEKQEAITSNWHCSEFRRPGIAL